ncbi:MAG: GtrA family protein [Caulobacterales bacterium]|uniref:GtrA family protein n=1 Tax=Glycocaulis sp. TaxID=1969725 RepID=UPI003F9FB224
MSRQFVTFVLAGGIAAGVNWVTNIILNQFMILEISVVLAYLAGMTTAFVLTRLFVFDASGRAAQHEYVRFALVNVVALVQVWLVTILLARFLLPAIGWTFQPVAVSHLVGVASPIVTSYLGHKYFTFAKVKTIAPEPDKDAQ